MSGDPRTDPAVATSTGKVATAWGGVLLAKAGITTWSDVAALFATIYTGWLLAERIWLAWQSWRARNPRGRRGRP